MGKTINIPRVEDIPTEPMAETDNAPMTDAPTLLPPEPVKPIDKRKKAAAIEAMELAETIWTEAMNTADSFGTEEDDLLAFIENAEDSIINPQQKYEDPDSFLNDEDCPVFVRGDFSITEGQAKSRKTFLSALLVSLLLSDGTRPGGTRFSTPTKCNRVLWFDTEQGKPRTARILKRLNKMGGDTSKITMFSMRELGAVGRFKTLLYFIVLHRPDFVLIDGVADLMNNPNDIPESAMIRQMLMTASAKYNCHICAVLHCNEKGDTSTARGQVGSELTRKCSTVLHLEAVGDNATKVTYTRTRDKKPDSFFIGVEEVDGYALPAFVDGANVAKPKKTTARVKDDLEAIRDFCKSRGEGVTRQEIIDFLVKVRNIKEGTTTDRRFTDAVENGYIEKHELLGLYYPI